MESKMISISDLRKVKGIGGKTIERILDGLDDSEYISKYNSNIHLDIGLHQGDCLELMNGIEDKSVDMILCDLPYGTTACSWDSVIDFNKLWKQYNRIVKDNGAIVLFGSEPFSTALRSSNLDVYRYDWKWIKQRGTGHLNSKKQPMRDNEDIIIFYKNQCVYNPQGTILGEFNNNRPAKSKISSDVYSSEVEIGVSKVGNYPTNTLYFDKICINQIHPTQKPVALLEYLIKTYTNEGQVVLDNTMGSGSTGVACKNTNRRFIGIEMDEDYFNVAKERLNV